MVIVRILAIIPGIVAIYLAISLLRSIKYDKLRDEAWGEALKKMEACVRVLHRDINYDSFGLSNEEKLRYNKIVEDNNLTVTSIYEEFSNEWNNKKI